MSRYTQKLFWNIFGLIAIIVIAFANWYWPFYFILGETTLYRFIWFGIFFVLLDLFIESILQSFKAMRLMRDVMGFSKDIHKLSDSFHLIPKVSLPNSLKADYVAIGSSGVWLVNLKDDEGVVTFNGEDLAQKGKVLKGLLTETLQRSYALADLLKKKLNRDFIITPIIAFTSLKSDLSSAPKLIRGIYLSSRQEVVSLIENTDIQLVDKNTSEEIYKILKK